MDSTQNKISVVPDLELVYKYKRDKDNKTAVSYANSEYLVVLDSLKGKFTCKALRAKQTTYEKSPDGSIIALTGKIPTVGIRLYLGGYVFDVPISITDRLREQRGFYFIPSYSDSYGSKYIRLSPVNIKGSDEVLYVSSLERCKIRGKRFKSRQVSSLVSATYLIDCYNGNSEFDLQVFKKLQTEGEVVSSIVSLEQEKLLEEFNVKRDKGLLDDFGQVVKQTPPTIEKKQELVSEPDMVLGGNETVKIQNLDDISDFGSGSKIQNLDDILDFVSRLALDGVTLAVLYGLVKDLAREVASIKASLASSPASSPASAPVSIPVSLASSSGASRKDFVVPESARGLSGELKNTQVNIYTKETNEFMVKALELYHKFKVIDNLSEKVSNNKTLDYLQRYYPALLENFVMVNKDKKNVGAYEIKGSTITGWYKLHFAVVDGVAVKKVELKNES